MDFTKDYPILINTLLYCVSFYIVFKKRREFDYVSLIFGVYLVSALSAYLLYYGFLGVKINYQIDLLPFLFLFVILLVAFYPIVKFKHQNLLSLIEPDNFIFTAISLYFIVVIITAQIIRFPEILETISLAIKDVSVLENSYATTAQWQQTKTADESINYLSVLSNISKEMVMLFFFYNLVRKKRNLIISWGLGVASFLPVFSNVLTGNRGGIVTALFSLLFLFLLFKPLLSQPQKRAIKTYLFISLSFFAALFIALSVARFSKGDNMINDAVLYSWVNYQGKAMLNINEYSFKEKTKQYGDNSFPMFRAFLGLDYSRGIYERQENWSYQMIIIQGAFYTFIGDLIHDFGPIWVVLIIITISSITRAGTKFKHKFRFHQIILLFIWYNICIQGTYYFTYKTIGGNLIIIFSLIVYFIFKLSSNRKLQNG